MRAARTPSLPRFSTDTVTSKHHNKLPRKGHGHSAIGLYEGLTSGEEIPQDTRVRLCSDEEVQAWLLTARQ